MGYDATTYRSAKRSSSSSSGSVIFAQVSRQSHGSVNLQNEIWVNGKSRSSGQESLVLRPMSRRSENLFGVMEIDERGILRSVEQSMEKGHWLLGHEACNDSSSG